ncbi:MAG: aldo/keto reductase [Actinomycetota bacterium]
MSGLPSRWGVPRLGLGTWAAGGTGWGPGASRRERLKLIERALDRGVSVFDTAPAYGDAEELLGRALMGDRDRVDIVTKVGPRDDPRRSLEASLRRLRTDRVDLLLLHECLDGFERQLQVLAALREEGKAGAVGVANASPDQLTRALELVPVAAYQGPYNLVDRDAERWHLPFCRERGLAFMAYRPLASGALAKTLDEPPGFEEGDHRRRIYWFRGRELERRSEVARRLSKLAEEGDTTLPALSLGWVLARAGVSVALAGARTGDQVDQNVEAATRPLGIDVVDGVDRVVEDVFRPPRATREALAAEWEPRERFIVDRLDGTRTFEDIAAEWSESEGSQMIAAQVKVFSDDLLERGLVAPR